MQVATKIGMGAVFTALAGTTLGFSAANADVPPAPPQVAQGMENAPAGQQGEPAPAAEEEAIGGIEVGPEGAAAATNRLLQRTDIDARWCTGRVVARGLNTRSGPGTNFARTGGLPFHAVVQTNWSSIVRNQGYLWVKLRNGNWVADYKLGNGNGKWYILYNSCR
ncbi:MULTISPECIES: SH3 domain-containing protein [Thermomonosporaceae]|uniref:SH3 domain-containing protein n=1 Tax=Thermomonosporaceae TaxID=2012 RepID=UPI00255B32D0|nr:MULTISPECIES: SH3 domain-containing protein [Thermomonosporaceae]MDL4776502.1 SH3 domain-containing protein [Actinomadura xylanilytica]